MANAAGVGRLIARTYSAFNLGFATPDQQAGSARALPVRRVDGSGSSGRDRSEVLEAPMVLVAEEAGAIVGVLRGGRLDGKGRTVLAEPVRRRRSPASGGRAPVW